MWTNCCVRFEIPEGNDFFLSFDNVIFSLGFFFFLALLDIFAEDVENNFESPARRWDRGRRFLFEIFFSSALAVTVSPDTKVPIFRNRTASAPRIELLSPGTIVGVSPIGFSSARTKKYTEIRKKHDTGK